RAHPSSRPRLPAWRRGPAAQPLEEELPCDLDRGEGPARRALRTEVPLHSLDDNVELGPVTRQVEAARYAGARRGFRVSSRPCDRRRALAEIHASRLGWIDRSGRPGRVGGIRLLRADAGSRAAHEHAEGQRQNSEELSRAHEWLLRGLSADLEGSGSVLRDE